MTPRTNLFSPVMAALLCVVGLCEPPVAVRARLRVPAFALFQGWKNSRIVL